MITERDSITNRVKGGVSQVHQRFLFLGDADGESGGFVFRDRLRGKRLSEVDVDDRGNGQQNQVGRSHEGREA